LSFAAFNSSTGIDFAVSRFDGSFPRRDAAFLATSLSSFPRGLSGQSKRPQPGGSFFDYAVALILSHCPKNAKCRRRFRGLEIGRTQGDTSVDVNRGT
jgi:hypothetical protein